MFLAFHTLLALLPSCLSSTAMHPFPCPGRRYLNIHLWFIPFYCCMKIELDKPYTRRLDAETQWSTDMHWVRARPSILAIVYYLRIDSFHIEMKSDMLFARTIHIVEELREHHIAHDIFIRTNVNHANDMFLLCNTECRTSTRVCVWIFEDDIS